jgi:hypothetical protein
MCALADGLATVDQTQQVCGQAAEKFASGDPDGAYAELSMYWPLPKEEIQNLGYQSKTQLGMVSTRFGALVGAEHAQTTLVGLSLVRHLFLIKFENHALRFSCIFYKPHKEWLVNAVIWDDKLQNAFGD